MGAELVVWFLMWMATGLAGKPFISSVPPELHSIVAFFGNWLTAGLAGAGSLLVWFFRRTSLPLTTYLSWVGGVSLGSIVLVLAIPHFLPRPASPQLSEEDTAYADGELKMRDSNWQQADHYFSRVSPSNPNYLHALTERGRAEFYMRDYASAEQRYQEVMRLQATPDEKLDAKYSLARIRLASGDAQGAATVLRNLVAEPRFHDSPQVILNLASADFDADNFEEAAALIARFPFAIPPEGEENRDIWGVAYFLRAELTARQNDFDCNAVRSDVASAQALVHDVLDRMDPKENLLSCVQSAH